MNLFQFIKAWPSDMPEPTISGTEEHSVCLSWGVQGRGYFVYVHVEEEPTGLSCCVSDVRKGHQECWENLKNVSFEVIVEKVTKHIKEFKCPQS